MNPEMDVGTNRKALQINLDAKMYGKFAEIGAGQEAGCGNHRAVAEKSFAARFAYDR